LARIRTAARLHDRNHAAIHLCNELGCGPSRSRRAQGGDGLAVAQGVLPHGFHGDFNGVMFPHPVRRLPKGNFRAEIRQHALQPLGIAAMFDLRFPTEGPEFCPARV